MAEKTTEKKDKVLHATFKYRGAYNKKLGKFKETVTVDTANFAEVGLGKFVPVMEKLGDLLRTALNTTKWEDAKAYWDVYKGEFLDELDRMEKEGKPIK